MNQIQLQNNSQSTIYWYGLAMAVLEVILGVLCVMGCVDETTMGALLIACAPLTQWVNANSPALANQYKASAAQVAEQAVVDESGK